ncbi:hypothetical protein ABZU76_18150 [Amycolatopsis sp. NPDC005232]|uniref:hypothetical protein n=1 Tax=Amycolatopsis sp. NPDC005232 TaxID=3157027 RepID=UPI0033A0D69C
MHIGDHSLSEHGQWKVAVDYQENIAAGLQILETTWNQLYSAGITANNADPRYLENWYFAAWAYNSGVQPNAANDNTTGCTPGPSCTSAHGTAKILTQDKSGLPTRSSGPMLVTVIFICTGERYPSPAWLLS